MHATTMPLNRTAIDLIAALPTGGLVSVSRKAMTVELSMRALHDGIEGDFVETGTFAGGTAVLMAKVLQLYDHGTPRRILHGFDSFKGLPDIASEDKKWSKEHDQISHDEDHRIFNATGLRRRSTYHGKAREFKASTWAIRDNFKRNKIDTSILRIHAGWFNTTLPAALRSSGSSRSSASSATIDRIAFLRVDGDVFTSTWESLHHLYSRLSPGGYVYIDDYGSYRGCKRAVDQFREQHGVSDAMHPVREEGVDPKRPWIVMNATFEAVWWRKSKSI